MVNEMGDRVSDIVVVDLNPSTGNFEVGLFTVRLKTETYVISFPLVQTIFEDSVTFKRLTKH